MLVPLFMTASLLAHVKQGRHQTRSADRQVGGHLGGQTRLLPCSRSAGMRRLTRPLSPRIFPAPTLFVLALPPTPPPALPFLPQPLLLTLTMPVHLALQPPQAQEEEDLAAAINRERQQHGLDPLEFDPLLCATARAHSREMCDLHYFNHESPTGGEQTPMDRYLAARHDAGAEQPHRLIVGENIFYASQTNDLYNINFAHQSLMASPEHRENILAPHFTKVGIGLCRDPQGRFWVTEMFVQEN